MTRTALVRGYGGGSGHRRQPPPAIRANADSGCCVARNAVVRAYDWTLEQQAVINLDYVPIHDIAYMGPQRILVGTSDYSDPRRGGMACFDASSGRLVHRYQLSDGGRLWSYNASDITTSEGQYVYASCRYGAGEQGAIGTWDQTTGQQVHLLSLDDLYLSLGYNMCKLQWLRESNCLLVATMEVNDGGCLSVLDLRSRQVVWPQLQGGRRGPVVSEDRIMDAVAIESSWTIWVVDDSDRLGFIDTRTGSAQITWGKPGDVFPVTPWDTHSPYIRHPKLAYWGSRLFANRDESVHVLASHDWNTNEFSETATVQRVKGGEIADISIGGDRLFLLHKETDSFEVWETPAKEELPISRLSGDRRQEHWPWEHTAWRHLSLLTDGLT